MVINIFFQLLTMWFGRINIWYDFKLAPPSHRLYKTYHDIFWNDLPDHLLLLMQELFSFKWDKLPNQFNSVKEYLAEYRQWHLDVFRPNNGLSRRVKSIDPDFESFQIMAPRYVNFPPWARELEEVVLEIFKKFHSTMKKFAQTGNPNVWWPIEVELDRDAKFLARMYKRHAEGWEPPEGVNETSPEWADDYKACPFWLPPPHTGMGAM